MQSAGLGAGLKHTFDHHSVKMHMWVEQGTEAVDEGDRADAGRHQTANALALISEQVAQHSVTGEREIQMQFIQPAHQPASLGERLFLKIVP